ncbi:FG-GAP-like repeat-containing protein [Micromonospora purpureochromogenes]|uniref:FG-GAP-like repeat-containing protein n=1 Tax=Micromonospora purpureochromogenes TaxID=47872 RepID=UPI0033F15626
MTDGLLAFLSWTRTGIAAGEAAPDPLTGDLPTGTPVELAVTVNTRTPQPLTARLYGPGDVTGLDTRQIIRTDPRPEDDTFPPHLFPLVEFDRPDLPWLLTPATPADRDRLRPWLVLVVVERDHAELVPGGALPALKTRLEQLPNLDESHLWAHAQVALDGPLDDARLDRLLAGAPDRTLSRLICPRHLQRRRAYLACLVPAFEPGRKTGLGLDLDDVDRTTLRPAWTAGTGDAPLLPVYHHWSFATGDTGSFEALVERLQGRPLPREVGVRDLDVSRPGGGLPPVDAGRPGAVVELEGALRSPATLAAPWYPPTRAAFEAALRPRLEPTDADQVIPPLYGLIHTGRRRFGGDADQINWLRQLNLDPRYRAIAALGTRAVQDNQEDLVAAAWEQVAALRELNQALRNGQLARTVDQAIYDRRIDASRPGPVLPDDRLLQITDPVHQALGTSAKLAAGRAVRATTTSAFRKITRSGRPLARLAGETVARPMARLAARQVTVTPPLSAPPGMASPESLSAGETMRALTGTRVKLPAWTAAPTGPTQQPVPADPLAAFPGAFMPGRVFVTTTDGRLMSRVTQGAFSGWQDHGNPPGTTAATSPAAIRDLRVYVTGGDRQVWELAWDGDCWAWQRLPLPDNLQVIGGNAPWTTWANSRPIGGGLARTGTYDMVWVVATDGNLYQLNSAGGWSSHGNPGVRVTGRPGSVDAWSLLVPGTDGYLWSRAINSDSGAWEWTQLRGLTTTAPIGGAQPFAVNTQDIRRFAGGRLANELWIYSLQLSLPISLRWTRARTDLGALLGVLPGQGVLISTTSGEVLLGSTANALTVTWQSFLPPPPGFTAGQVLRGAVRPDGVVMTAVNGNYLEGSGGTWTDLGRPLIPGVGAPYATPAQHRRWRPVLGLMGSMVVAHVDAAAGGDRLHERVGADLGYDAEVRGGWNLLSPMPGTIGTDTQGMGIALADVRGRGGDAPRRDLVALWIQDYGGGNFPTYRVGFDLGAGGAPTSWSPVKRCPTPVATTITSGGALTIKVRVRDTDIDVADLDGDGHPELVMAYVSEEASPRAFYRIGWSLNGDGDVTQGWSESQPLPAPGAPTVGIGVAVADVTGDLRPDLVVLYVTRAAGGGLQATYRIGFGLNARGRVTGGWSAPVAVGGGPLPAALQGVALTVADLTGNERPDLVVLLVENGPTNNTGWYRVGRDLNPTTREAQAWSTNQLIPGGFGWENRGAGVAIGDLDPQLMDRKKVFAQAFHDAAKDHQAVLAVAQRLAAADDAVVPLQTIASATRAALQPARRVEQRVAARVQGIDLTHVPATDRLNPVLAAPSFDVPAYELVRDIAREHLLPGVNRIPPDTVSLLRATPAFIESFLVGLNHEMARELLWREVPADRTSTFFRQFWNRTDGDADIPPIDKWRPTAQLGASAAGVGGPDMAVLVIRGELLRRYPNTVVSAIRATYGADGRRTLTTTTLTPDFHGSIDPDILFFGFPFTVAEARGAVGTDAGWFFAFQEHPTEPRFGLDEPGAAPTWGKAPAAWNHLDWAAVVPNQAALDTLTHVPLSVPFPRDTTLSVRDDRPGADTFRWAENGAHTAHITLQRPVLFAIHATDLLPHTTGEWHVTHVVRVRRSIAAVAGQHPDGRWWRLSLAEAIAAVRLRERLFVQPPGQPPAEVVVVRGRGGREYLRTRAGGGLGDNLRALPDLPKDANV